MYLCVNGGHRIDRSKELMHFWWSSRFMTLWKKRHLTISIGMNKHICCLCGELSRLIEYYPLQCLKEIV